MHADRVDIFDATNHHCVVGGVAHQLKLVFLPPEDALFEQNLGGWACLQAGATDSAQVFFVVGESRTEPAHGERWAHDQRIAELGGTVEQFIHGVGDYRLRYVCAGIEHKLLERLAVFAGLDGLDLGADEFDVVLLENAEFVEAHGSV